MISQRQCPVVDPLVSVMDQTGSGAQAPRCERGDSQQEVLPCPLHSLSYGHV